MGGHGDRFHHRPEGKGDILRQGDDAVFRYDEIVLRSSVGLEGLDPEMLADIVLAPTAGIAFPADELGTAGDLLSRCALAVFDGMKG